MADNFKISDIDLFDRYINDRLSPSELAEFEARLKSDKLFATNFTTYLLSVDTIYKEAQQENTEFGVAMRSLSKSELNEIIGRKKGPKLWRVSYLRERFMWASGIAALFIIGFFIIFSQYKSSEYQKADLIAYYNDVPSLSRGGVEEPEFTDLYCINPDEQTQLSILERQYKKADKDDIQAREDAGLRLVVAYLKCHKISEAKTLLKELIEKYADDEDFAAQCKIMLQQLD